MRVGVAERRSVDYLDTQSGDVRRQAAELLNSPIETIRAIHVEGAGCYEHNGADDVGAEAALIAAWIPGKPIRLQWMRDQEFSWEPLGLGMVTEVGRRRCRRPDCQMELRCLEQSSQQPAGRGRRHTCWKRGVATVSSPRGQANPNAGRRRQSQF